MILLAPQGEKQTLMDAVRDLGLDGPVATVTAGWEEREAEDAALAAHLECGAVNLGLWPRAEEVFREAPGVRAVLFERHDRLRELASVYRLRLAPQLAVCRELLARTDPARPDPLVGPELEDAIDGLRRLDAHHLARAAELDLEVAERLAVEGRGAVERHRDELRALLEPTRALLVAGGHVGVLLNRLRLFGVLELTADKPVVAWSGGAMVLGERIVLFHDSPPRGPGDAEVYAPGLGLVRGVVPLPHARHRLRLDDPARVALFARRFAPDLCVPLDAGERLDGTTGGDSWEAVSPARRLTATGAVEEVAA